MDVTEDVRELVTLDKGSNIQSAVQNINSRVRGWYEGISARGTIVLVPGYKGISAVVRILVPRYEGISAGVRGYLSRGTRVLVPRYESIRAGERAY